MNRLKRELTNRGYIGDNEMDVLIGRASVEWSGNFVGIQNGFIIVTSCTNVLDPMFILLDRNFNKIAEQCIWLNNMTHCNPDGQKNPWDSLVYSTKPYIDDGEYPFMEIIED